jgi:phage major head subunit gpT-like protein
MRKFKDESSEPFDLIPTHMRVGPDLEQRAKEILEAMTRATFVDMTGSESTTAVETGAQTTNVWSGELELIVDPRMGSAYHWDLYDLSIPGVMPMVLVEERAPVPVHQDQLTDSRRFTYDEFVFGVEADFKVGAGAWMTAYRGTGTA